MHHHTWILFNLMTPCWPIKAAEHKREISGRSRLHNPQSLLHRSPTYRYPFETINGLAL